VESLTLPVDSAAAQVLGAVPLQPENSRNVGAGIVLTPVPTLELAIDYYHIAIDDRIVLSGNFTATPIAALLAPFNANSARFFTNAIDTRTDGVDVTANYTIRLSASDAYLRIAYNNTSTDIVGTVATPPQLAAYSSVLFDRIEQRRVECAQPKDSLRLGGGWKGRQLAIDVLEARYGTICSLTLNPVDDQQYGAKWLTDVELSYRLAGYRVAIGAQNLFDVWPDRNTAINSFNGIQTFPSFSPFGMNGRTLYVRLGGTF